MKAKQVDQVYVVYFTENNGNRYIETITDNPKQWLKYHNIDREEDEQEKLDDFELVLTTYEKYN